MNKPQSSLSFVVIGKIMAQTSLERKVDPRLMRRDHRPINSYCQDRIRLIQYYNNLLRQTEPPILCPHRRDSLKDRGSQYSCSVR